MGNQQHTCQCVQNVICFQQCDKKTLYVPTKFDSNQKQFKKVDRNKKNQVIDENSAAYKKEISLNLQQKGDCNNSNSSSKQLQLSVRINSFKNKSLSKEIKTLKQKENQGRHQHKQILQNENKIQELQTRIDAYKKRKQQKIPKKLAKNIVKPENYLTLSGKVSKQIEVQNLQKSASPRDIKSLPICAKSKQNTQATMNHTKLQSQNNNSFDTFGSQPQYYQLLIQLNKSYTQIIQLKKNLYGIK